MRIGILGGSFNPIHNGHIALARTVREVLNLDRIWFMPTGRHPLKEKDILLDSACRVALVKTAIQDQPGFDISLADLNSTGPCYTDELLQKLQLAYPEHQFYFIMGADNVPQLPRWHNWEWLIEHGNLVAVNRPDTDMQELQKLEYAAKITFITITPIPISSTMIRNLVQAGKTITGLVPDNIEHDVIACYQ